MILYSNYYVREAGFRNETVIIQLYVSPIDYTWRGEPLQKLQQCVGQRNGIQSAAGVCSSVDSNLCPGQVLWHIFDVVQKSGADGKENSVACHGFNLDTRQNRDLYEKFM